MRQGDCLSGSGGAGSMLGRTVCNGVAGSLQ